MPENSLPNSANPQIAWLLAELLRHCEGVDLTDWPDDYAKLEVFADKARGWLAQQSQAVIMLEEALPRYRLHTVIHRATIEALMDLRETSPVYSSQDPPDRCPACKRLLNGYWDCNYCGLELENAYRNSKTRHASAQPINQLPLFYLLLPDPARQRVVILDGHTPRRVVWEISSSLKRVAPYSAVMHQEHSVLLADTEGNSVGEYGLFGDCYWSFDTTKEGNQLERPVAITAFIPKHENQELYLVVDQGQHRVLTVNRASEIVWEYGVRGEAGLDPGYLDLPASAQYTPDGTYLIADSGNARVVEVFPQRDNLICWETERELGLIRPSYAQRLHNGHTLIVDPGSYRILEIDKDGVPLEECIYYQDSYDERLRMEHPQTVIRLPNKHVILADKDFAVEIDLPSRELVWSAALADLSFPHQEDLRQTLHPDEELIRSLRMELAMQQGHFDLETSLRRVKMFEDAPLGFYAQLKDYLTEQHVPAGEFIVKEGDTGDSMFVLARGKVKVRRQGDEVATLHTGEIFGEMALVLNQPRAADIVAEEDCNVLMLKRQDFENMLQTYPLIRERIRKLAQVRTGLRKMDAFAYGSDRLANVKALLDKQYQRVAEIKHNLGTSRSTSLLGARRQPEWRLLYNRIERHIIHEAACKHHLCYEIHVEVDPAHASKPETAAMVYDRLEELGTPIKIWPVAEQLMEGRWEQQMVLTLLTRSGREQVLQEVHDLEEVTRVAVHGIWF
ncbi:MAG TPA: cyclic nucleotide-binding domain-containing protein [Candidatus Obscuribacterales bacterium]